MADLNVQPKNRNNWWLWLFLSLLVLTALFFLFKGCNKGDHVALSGTADSISNNVSAVTDSLTDDWDDFDLNLPETTYEEMKDEDIKVRANDRSAVYSLEENILFRENESSIRPEASGKLKQISASIEKRFTGSDLRIYGYTDSKGSIEQNKELAKKRSEAVQRWLLQNGNIAKEKISLHPIGESEPTASNATAEGRAENRRVEIVVRKK